MGINFTRIINLVFIVLALASLASSAEAAELRRGPYFLNPSPDRVTIRWRTDLKVATQSVVRIGDSPNSLGQIIKASRLNTQIPGVSDWIASIENLKPDTRYYYALEADHAIIAGASDTHFFETISTPSDDNVQRYWFLGDSGTNQPYPGFAVSPFGDQLSPMIQVRNSFRKFLGDRKLDAIVMLGDNAYPIGSDREYQTAFFNVLQSEFTTTPIWPCVGNHDYNVSFMKIFGDPFYFKTTDNPGMFPLYYSFNQGNVHFTILDPWKSFLEASTSPDHPQWKKQMQWLEADLKSSNKHWNILINHFPFFTDGDYNSDIEPELTQLREMLVPIVDKYGVDLVIAAHDHAYERSYLIAGHKGKRDSFNPDKHIINNQIEGVIEKGHGPGSGTIYIVSGSAGGSRGATNFQHPAMVPLAKAENGKRGIAIPGSFVLEINGDTITGTQIGTGKDILDSFKLKKTAKN